VLTNLKSKTTRQTLILMHITLCESFLLLTLLPYWISSFFREEDGIFNVIFDSMNHAFAMVVTFMLIILTTDRVIACTKPLFYRNFVTHDRVRLSLVVTWTIGGFLFAFSSILRWVVLKVSDMRLYENILLSVLYVITLIFAIVSYSYIYHTISVRNKRMKSQTVPNVVDKNQIKRDELGSPIQRTNILDTVNSNADTISICYSKEELIEFKRKMYQTDANSRSFDRLLYERKKKRKLIKISLLIVLSFAFFSFAPALIAVLQNQRTTPVYRQSINLAWEINFICTPLIYIFGQTKTRRLLSKKFKQVFRM